jgi:hypothetical protein
LMNSILILTLGSYRGGAIDLSAKGFKFDD